MSRIAVTNLKVSHFRSYKNVEISTSGCPVALFGSNGAGKTNILEALSLLSPGRGLRRSRVDEMERKPEGIGWKISATLQSLGQIHEIETNYTGDGSLIHHQYNLFQFHEFGLKICLLYTSPSPRD